MILVIDNYDSFTYNLVQYLGELVSGQEINVYRNDQIWPEEITELKPQKIVFSPGPGNPDSAGNCLQIIRQLSDKIPLLGVCLGHQVIGQAFGGEIMVAGRLMHGKVSQIIHSGNGLFAGIKQGFEAARYHSLVVNPATLPATLEVTARSEDGEIMGLKHRQKPIWGIQFHPESILTTEGKSIIKNYLFGEEFSYEDNGSDRCCNNADRPQ
jgi:anthranilate synthase/aminodeoxychorismate synthase-like glutamine amidotransferase